MKHGGHKKFYALGRLKTGAMNKGESQYAQHLKREEQAGRVLWWKFEGLKLRLADNTFYTPDFAVLTVDCVLECHEVKGWMMEDANAKIKIASDMYPFRFILLQVRAKRDGGGWTRKEYGHGEESEPVPVVEELPLGTVELIREVAGEFMKEDADEKIFVDRKPF